MTRKFSEAATSWLRDYHGSIDATALLLAHEAGQRVSATRPTNSLTPEWVRDQDGRDILAVRWETIAPLLTRLAELEGNR